jgi:hypothetical protein
MIGTQIPLGLKPKISPFKHLSILKYIYICDTQYRVVQVNYSNIAYRFTIFLYPIT